MSRFDSLVNKVKGKIALKELQVVKDGNKASRKESKLHKSLKEVKKQLAEKQEFQELVKEDNRRFGRRPTHTQTQTKNK